jgi:hypothetical protein
MENAISPEGSFRASAALTPHVFSNSAIAANCRQHLIIGNSRIS